MVKLTAKLVLFQERPEPAVPSELLVPAAEPSEEGEQGSRHAQRHLPQQRHHEVHAGQRGLHTASQKGETVWPVSWSLPLGTLKGFL